MSSHVDQCVLCPVPELRAEADTMRGAAQGLERALAAANAEVERLQVENHGFASENFALEAEVERLKASACQCGEDEACAYLRRAETAEAEVERLRGEVANLCDLKRWPEYHEAIAQAHAAGRRAGLELAAKLLDAEVTEHRAQNKPHRTCDDYGCSTLECFADTFRALADKETK
jgi:chromosome segregation ATPase